MATIEELHAGLIKADAAGNSADAKAFADAIRSMQPAAPAPAEISEYSNEGRSGRESVPTPQTVGDRVREHPLTRTLEAVGQMSGDGLAGLMKSGADATKSIVKGLPPIARLALDPKLGGSDIIEQGSKSADKLYKQAGPAAAVSKLAGDLALQGGASNLGKIAGEKAVPVAETILKRSLQRGVEGAVAGGAGAALLPPGEGETRAGNALEGAAFGGVAGPVGGAIGDGVLAAKNYLSTGARAALTRANAMFDDVLGKGAKDSVTANMDLPRALPMSTAAAAGRPELDAMERISRGTANPRNNGRWARLDERTNTAGLEKLNAAVGDDIAQLQPRAAEVQDTLREAQNAMNKIKFKNPERQVLSDDLIALKQLPEFENNRKMQQYVNNLAGDLLDPGVTKTVGGLAHLETDISQNLEGPAAGMVWETVRKHIDANGGGAWSEAYNLRSEAQKALGQSTAANNILGDFQSAYGNAKGKIAPSGEAAIGSKRLETAVNKFGETKPDANGAAEDLLNPDTRHEVNNLIDALRKAEGPRAGKGGSVGRDTAWGNVALDRGGNPIPGVNNSWYNAAKTVLRKVTGDRGASTARAADTALRSSQGWQKMLDAAEKSKEINASDAAMLARILRAGDAAGAAAVTGE